MVAPTNRALWQDDQGVPGVIRASSLPTGQDLGDRKVLVKVHAWAINPCDHVLQDRDMTQYPLILGCDVAGTVEAVAPGSTAATKFCVGDQIFGFNFNSGFQDCVALEDRLIAKIPCNMAYRDVVGLGLCSATSAMFLFGKEYLHLDMPKVGASRKGQSVLVWGGSSAVGSNAIQLAVGAGYDIISTCSTRNFDHVKSLGASQVFDYNDPNVTEKVAVELDKGECAGVFMAAGLDDGNAAALKVAAASKQMLTPDKVVPFPDCWFEAEQATFGGYLPEALANGSYKVAPPPLVVNKKGLEGLQEAVDIMRAISEKGQEGVKEAIEKAGDGANKDMTVMKVVVERS